MFVVKEKGEGKVNSQKGIPNSTQALNTAISFKIHHLFFFFFVFACSANDPEQGELLFTIRHYAGDVEYDASWFIIIN